MRSISVLLLVCVLFFSAHVAHAAFRAEGVVAVLSFKDKQAGQELIFLSDLERYRLFFEPYAQDFSQNLNSIEAAPEEKAFRERLDQVIHQRIFEQEALRFSIKKPEEKVVEARLRLVRARFKNEADFQKALQQTGLLLSELQGDIVRFLWVEQLIQERIREFIFIGPRAIETYYLNHLEQFIGQPLEIIEMNVRTILSKEKEDSKKKAYLKRLKEKVVMEILLNEE